MIGAAISKTSKPPSASSPRSRMLKKVKRIIGKAFRVLERQERSVNAVFGLAAITIAIVSLLLSARANRIVERANQINEEAARLAKDASESKKVITLKAAISGDPPILTLAPISSDFVLSSSLVFFPCTGEGCPRVSDDRSAAGVHDLSAAVASIEDVVKQRDNQRYVDPDDWVSEQWLPQWYPILVRLDYVYEGRTIEAHQVYIVLYRDPTSMVFNRREHTAEPKDQVVRLERAYFLEGVPENEKPLETLEKEYRHWRRYVDMGPAYTR